MKTKLVSSSPSELEWVTLYYNDLSALLDLIKSTGDDIEIEIETDIYSECTDISELRKKLGTDARIQILAIKFSPGYNHLEFNGNRVRLFIGSETTEALGLKVLLFDYLKKHQSTLLVVISNGWFIGLPTLFVIASLLSAKFEYVNLAATFLGLFVVVSPFVLYSGIAMTRWRPIRFVEYRDSKFFDKNTIIKIVFGTCSILATAISGIAGVAYSEQIKAFLN